MENQNIQNQEGIKNNTEMTLDSLVAQIKDEVDIKQFKSISWWKEIPRKNKLNVGDVVLVPEINKYGIVCGPAKKEGLIKLRVLKKQLSKGSYNRDWYVSSDQFEVVRKNDKMMPSFICAYDKIYKIIK